jgi:2-polyprenyl-3-methyl-5-hydroxy-6-metoxy-1,4-benzoquinol methylase
MNEMYADTILLSPIERKIKAIHERRFDHFVQFGLRGKKILDVGCGAGVFLRHARKKRYEAYGLDISKKIVCHIRSMGIAAYQDFQSLPQIKFDAITNFDVIEHMTDPHVFIRNIKRKLKKGGLIMITTPNAFGISGLLLHDKWWVLDPKSHFILYNIESLQFLLKKHGFAIHEVSTDMITQWLVPSNSLRRKIFNKIIYLILYPFLPLLFSHRLGDNIQIIAKYK